MIKNKSQKRISKKREKQTRYLSQAIQLEESVNPHIIRATMTMVSLAILTFLIWAGLTNINEVARTPGEVVPNGYQQTVQHLEGGVVKMINVREGDIVEKDQILLTLSAISIKEDLERASSKQIFLENQIERLRAFVDGRNPEFSKDSGATSEMIADQQAFFEGMKSARVKEKRIIQDQISQKTQSIQSLESDLEIAQENMKIAKDMHDRRNILNKKGYASDMQLLEDQRKINQTEGEIKRLKNQILVANTEIDEFKGRLESLSARHRDETHERLNQLLVDRAQNIEIVHKLKERIDRLKIRSPSRGYVKGLGINTIGAVIQPGQTIMEIVPLDKELEVSIKIAPQHIGHLHIGQPVQVKFSTFDFSRYGSVKGTLDQISATTFSGEDGARYYQGRVLLEKNFVGINPDNIIMPGMTIMADIITGKKTILQYMLKPIHISLGTAFTER